LDKPSATNATSSPARLQSQPKNSRARSIIYLGVLTFVLLAFTFPALRSGTLSNFSGQYSQFPWSGYKPPKWYSSSSIDPTPIYLFNPSDLLARKLISQGKSFAWNPYIGLGAPWLGAMQPAQYFPGKLIPYLSSDYWHGTDIMKVLLLLLAGGGTFMLLRALGIGREGALFSALSYMLCERLFVLINMPAFHVETLLPLMLYSIKKMTAERSVLYGILASVIGGVQFLGGMPESSFTFAIIASTFFLLTVYAHRLNLGAAVGFGLLTCFTTLAISGFQLGEFARYLPLASHAHTGQYGEVVLDTKWILPLLLPNPFGSPFTQGHFSLFCGTSSVILAMSALLAKWDPSRRAFLLYFAGAFFIFAGYDFGLPLLRTIGQLPVFDHASIVWNAYAIPFSVAVMAGFGVNALIRKDAPKRIGVSLFVYVFVVAAMASQVDASIRPAVVVSGLVLIAVVPALLWCAWLMSRRYQMQWGSALLFALVSFEAYFCVSQLGFIHFWSATRSEPPSIKWLADHVGHERIFGLRGVLPADTLLPYRIRDMRHLDALYPDLYLDYVSAIWPSARSDVYTSLAESWTSFDHPLMDLAAVRYVVVPRSDVAKISLRPEKYTIGYEDNDVVVYLNRDAFARARIVHVAKQVSSDSTAQMLVGTENGGEATVYLESGQSVPDLSPCESSADEVAYELDDPDQVQLKLSTKCSGYVVLTDLYYPGWQASIDGKPSEIYRANFAFRAVKIEPGQHSVRFSYRPLTISIGFPLSAVTCICVIVYIVCGLVGIFSRLLKK
jgi:hypothetical protein